MDDNEQKIMSAYFSKIGKIGGKKGGETTKRLYGYEHYKKLAEHMNEVKKAKREANKR